MLALSWYSFAPLGSPNLWASAAFENHSDVGSVLHPGSLEYDPIQGTYTRIAQAGGDSLQMFQQYGSRIKLLHLKDRKPGFPITQVKDAATEYFTEVGAGTVHWQEIFAAAGKNGVKHLFVERDSSDLPAMESLRISFLNLQKIG